VNRIFINAATILSLVICAAAVTLLARSYWVSDCIILSRYWREANLERMEEAGSIYHTLTWRSGRGGAMVEASDWYTQFPGEKVETFVHSSEGAYNVGASGSSFWNRLGFERYADPNQSGVVFPLWAGVAVTCPLPLGRAWRVWRGRRRKHAGLCPHCGYDLRATSNRCPECGKRLTACWARYSFG